MFKNVDSKTEINFRQDFAMGNGILIGTDGSVGFQMGGDNKQGEVITRINTSTKKTYGYLALETGELICIEVL